MKISTFAFMVLAFVLPGTACAADREQVIEMQVTEQGFEPRRVAVKKGRSVKLVITRTTDKTCATDIVIDEHNVKEPLPLNKPVTVRFTPNETGELKYGCAMEKMLGGVIAIE